MSWRNRLMVILLAVGGFLAIAKWGHRLSADVVAREEERDALLERNRRLIEDNFRLEQEIAALKQRPDDPAWNALVDREIARIAREELHMTKAGEVVFEIHGLASPHHAGPSEVKAP